ncbi:MAG TPA: hypothetical protein VFC67_25165 [Prolixibacteraceae bacterium]|nr:hypothetical protein [Prolixibacteraceae bacterium]
MFFFGAFSGNLIYLILAISYLAGFSTLAFRSTEDKTEDLKLSEVLPAPNKYDNASSENSFQFYTTISDNSDQAQTEAISLQPPMIPVLKVLFIPPPLSGKSHFSGSALFSRPPPYSLV